jgi:4-amino-4-deoxy-L-arabinose transferase-like glycosyltransferase
MGRRANKRQVKPYPDDRLARYRRWILCAVVGLAALIRITYLLQLGATPLLNLHGWQQSDMHYFDDWARDIAAGDYLSRSIGVPMHRWHRETATHHLAASRDLPPPRSQAEDDARLEQEKALWAQWMKAPAFYQDPLYPYLVAGTYAAFGPDVRFVFAWQMLLGIATTLLLWRLTLIYFGDAAAVLATVLALLCGPLLFYEGLLLRESAIVFASVAIVALTERAFGMPGARRFTMLGLALGIAILLKSTFVLVLIAVMVAACWIHPKQWRTAFAPLVLGAALGIAPLVVRNIAVGVRPVSMATSGPLTLLTSNSRNALPEVGFGIDTRALARFLGQTDGGWVSAIRQLAAEQSMMSYAALVREKWRRVWHWYEIPNNENIYYMQTQFALLGRLPVTWWLCSGLAIVGLIVAAPRVREVWPLYLVVSSSTVPLLMFYVLGRFRLPVLVLVLPFCAQALVALIEWGRAGQLRRVAPAAVAVLLVGVWTGAALGPRQTLIRVSDWILPYSAFYQSKVYEALDARDAATASRWYVEFFQRYEPELERRALPGNAPLALELADMHRECAQILSAAHDPTGAERHRARADELLHWSDR